MQKYSVGLDVSSKKIDICISAIDTQQKVVVKSSTQIANSITGFNALDAWLQKQHKDKSIPLVVCMEATGIYYENCALFLFEKGPSEAKSIPTKPN